MVRMLTRALFLRSPSRASGSSPQEDELWLPPKRAVPAQQLKPNTIRNVRVPQAAKTRTANPAEISGKCYVIDGDTIQIGKVRIRLAGIDAPELDHLWGKKAKWELAALWKGNTIIAKLTPDMAHARVVATCYLPDGRDLSAEMVRCGLALDWPKFSGGRYSYLEPKGVRNKHWKAAARQRGHMHVFHK